MEAHEAMTIREIAIGHLQHAMACVGCLGLDDMGDLAAVLVLNNCKKSLEKMDSAEHLEYQEMLETLSIQPPRPATERELLRSRDVIEKTSKVGFQAQVTFSEDFKRIVLNTEVRWTQVGWGLTFLPYEALVSGRAPRRTYIPLAIPL